MKWLFIFIMVSIAFCSKAQVEHNFKMTPENTDCHTLSDSLNHLASDSIKKILEAKRYRFEQSITLSQYQTPRKLNFLSCEGERGFIIAQETENTIAIFDEVPKILWDSLLNHRDPINFYKKSDLKKYQIGKSK